LNDWLGPGLPRWPMGPASRGRCAVEEAQQFHRDGLVRGIALGAGGAVDPVVGQDADPVAQVEDERDIPEQEIAQGSAPGLHDADGGSRGQA